MMEKDWKKTICHLSFAISHLLIGNPNHPGDDRHLFRSSSLNGLAFQSTNEKWQMTNGK
jgi:hypothetical protein